MTFQRKNTIERGETIKSSRRESIISPLLRRRNTQTPLHVKAKRSANSLLEDEFELVLSERSEIGNLLEERKQLHTWKVIKVKDSEVEMKRQEIQLQREFFEREEKLKADKARRENMKDPSQKSRCEEERLDKMIQMLLNKDQSDFPFLEIEPCIN